MEESEVSEESAKLVEGALVELAGEGSGEVAMYW